MLINNNFIIVKRDILKNFVNTICVYMENV